MEIKAYWFKSPNFGDALSPMLIEHMSGTAPRYAHPRQANLIATGSVLFAGGALFLDSSRLCSPFGLFKMGLKVIDQFMPQLKIWGSGFLSDPGLDSVIRIRDTQVLAVRGVLTLSILKRVGIVNENEESTVALGDPGLLYPMLLEKSPKIQYDIGVVPHFHDQEIGRILAKQFERMGLRTCFVDVIQENPLTVLSQIGSCERIISSSLHGLIVADAWKIPRQHVLFSNLGQHDQDVLFKFRDYGSAIADDWSSVISGKDALLDPMNALRSAHVVSQWAIEDVIGKLKQSFPYSKNHDK